MRAGAIHVGGAFVQGAAPSLDEATQAAHVAATAYIDELLLNVMQATRLGWG